MLRRAALLIIVFILSFTVTLGAQSSRTSSFPWKKKWTRHQLYKMALYYFEVGNAFYKKGKKVKAKHCYLHAANVSPYSDIGASSRKKLRDEYSTDLREPTIADLVAWLKKQPDLTPEEKEFIKRYESGNQDIQSGEQTTGRATPPQEGQQGDTQQPTGQQGTESSQTTPPQTQPEVNDAEIRNQGERIPYRDDSSGTSD